MKIELKEYYWKIPEQVLINDLIAVSKKLGRKSFTMNDYRAHGQYHPRTFQNRFKSWYRAMKRAGLHSCRLPVALNKSLLFENLRQVWRKLGKQPGFKDMKAPASKYAGTTYVNHFGSWMNALRGFVEYEKYRLANGIRIVKPGIPKREAKKGQRKKIKRSPRGIPLSLRYRVLMRDGFRCMACGRSPATEAGVRLHLDHIRPWSKGGNREYDNLRTLCAECNIGRGNRMERGRRRPNRPVRQVKKRIKRRSAKEA